MDLGNKAAKRYVTSQAKRALGNLDSKRGTFAENSLFAEELRAYFRGERDFVGLSQQIGEFIVGELSRMEKTPSTDLLVVDFEGDADQTVREMTDEEAEAAYKARGPRYFRDHSAGEPPGLHARSGQQRLRRHRHHHRAAPRHSAEPVSEGGVVRAYLRRRHGRVVRGQGARNRR